MLNDRENNQPQLPKSSDFVRKYLTGIFLMLCLIVLSVFWGFSYRSNALIKTQLLKQGQAFFGEVVITRSWAAKHGGVYVKITPETVVNPYLLQIPGLKVVIKDEDGVAYTLKNPALMTRELSEIAAAKGMFKFKITSLDPLNPTNTADTFEQAALTSFAHGVKEYYRFEQEGDKVYFRYMAPLTTMKPCLKCHAQQGYKEGDVRGGISVSIPATDMLQQIKENRYYITLIALCIVGLIYAIIRYVARVFVGDLNRAEQQLREMANHDFLTGLLNRREAYRQVEEEMGRSARTGRPLAFILFDIDCFKRLNDTYGHNAGDMVLKQLGAKLVSTLRDYDIACRYGGEEFLVVAPETDLKQAVILAERLRMIVSEANFSTDAEDVAVTVSMGVSMLQHSDTIETAISRADVALYQAKEGGRNRVCMAGEAP
ncbi:MAG: diguanylate cyclase [Desulfuromonadaceae bacterium]|nr:diguanylate cyclase [Desulfuromonadaceae bacterium]MDD2849116.1 diguanylate cyclase [Desulfuromonadaceae bacterium]MDD4129484.1 diguanylate cyclase [Desulfuromonadaceae bacterium]